MQREALALFLETFGQRHFQTLTASDNLAGILIQSGRFEEAAKLLQETTSIRIEVLGEDHPETQVAKKILALIASK